MHIEIDEAKCIGAGQCVVSAPNVFDQREDDGIVILLDADPADSETTEVQEAIALCPARAIWENR